MADAFATSAQLGKRLRRTFSTDEKWMVDAILEDASAYLRGEVLGWQVYPHATVTYKQVLGRDRRYLLPTLPVISVESVKVDDVDVDFACDGSAIWLPRIVCNYGPPLRFGVGGELPSMVEISYVTGYETAPDDLVLWTCVLGSQALDLVEELGRLSSSGIQAVGIDDYRAAFFGASDGGGGGFELPERIEEKLRGAYGRNAYVTGQLE